MKAALASTNNVVDVGHAGTAMRFLTAYWALGGMQNRTLTGSGRMQQRPIAALVEALRSIGAGIAYAGNEGYPPLCFTGAQLPFEDSVLLDASLSSQYASALLLAGCGLPSGLHIALQGHIASRSYLDMTLNLMQKVGIECGWQNESTVYVRTWQPQTTTFTVEGDWSAASYWFAACGISGQPITLKPLRANSLQPDRAVLGYFSSIGVAARFEGEALYLTPTPLTTNHITIDFGLTPDIAQTLMVYCAARGITLTATGLNTLKIKETDRIAAMQTELSKLGFRLDEVKPETYRLVNFDPLPLQPVSISTYDDHRMALAFAPFMIKKSNVIIENEAVMSKSYPLFAAQWQGFLKTLG